MQAWLTITPEGSEITNEERYGGDLPAVTFEYGHIARFFTEIGVAGQGFGNLVPLSWENIRAWGELMDINLTPFESSLIHRMSIEYVSIANNRESDCPIASDEVRKNINSVNASAWSSLGTRANG